ncbi:gastrin/cholecystokinin type B receptor [Biomphalaria glabrata]|nr:gastrin/cholecystokinin type B receptor [Biomphalaria glabrata]
MTAINYVYNVWVLGTTACKITSYMQGVCIVASILTILFMSFDRYFAIRHPMRNRQIFTVSRVRRLIFMTWLTAGVVVMPIAFVNEVIKHALVSNSYCTEIWPTHVMRQIYDISLVVCIYLVPGVTLVVLYILMGCRLWARDTNLQRQNSISHQDEVLLARRRLALMLIIVSLLFATSWLPYHIINICIDFEIDASGQLILTYPFAILLGHSKSAQNPILYCFMHKGFHTFLLKLVRCHCTSGHTRKQRALNLSISRSDNSSPRSPTYKMINQRVVHCESSRDSAVTTCIGETSAMLGSGV